MKGNLVSDILQDNPILPLVFAEQVINGAAIIWDIDGKQRCTNVKSFVRNGFKVSKNVEQPFISYQLTMKDELGNVKLDELGYPTYEQKTFDIRGKKHSDLPEELRDKFNDYTFEVTQYLNCSDKDYRVSY